VRVPLALLALVGVLLAAGCGASHRSTSPPPPPPKHASEPHRLVPWQGIVGDIRLGGSEKHVLSEYGTEPHRGVLRLHGGKVQVDFRNGRVILIDVRTPYYRTKTGIGVGGRIPLGPCARTLAPIGTTTCGHLWHGFLWREFVKETACQCWVKVGLGKTSLSPSVSNFLKPWLFVYLRRGRVADFYFVLHFVD
jgi:hypothetical protein